MAYDIKNVFYLDTAVTLTAATTGSGSAQLDLSAYIDPISKGRTKGTGLAIYKVHYTFVQDAAGSAPVKANEAGVFTYGLAAGLGIGNNDTGGIALGNTTLTATNNLLVSQGMYYGPASTAGSGMNDIGVMPSEKVPYVVVRDNVCLIYDIVSTSKVTTSMNMAVRLECAQISLDQATLNQLLRTQTV